MILCLSISTYRGIALGAVHFYGRLKPYDGDGRDMDVLQELDAKEATQLNLVEGVETGDLAAYRVGDRCSRFQSRERLIEWAIKLAIEEHGVGVEIYAGNRVYDLKDMEMIYPPTEEEPRDESR